MSCIETQTLEDNEFHVGDVPPGSAAVVGDAAAFNVNGNFCATQAKCTHPEADAFAVRWITPVISP